MNETTTRPIPENWTSSQPAVAWATAAQVNSQLAQLRVCDIDQTLIPDLAAAATELALGARIPCRFGTDDAPVCLVRLIAKVAITQPDCGGPHTARLLNKLQH